MQVTAAAEHTVVQLCCHRRPQPHVKRHEVLLNHCQAQRPHLHLPCTSLGLPAPGYTKGDWYIMQDWQKWQLKKCRA